MIDVNKPVENPELIKAYETMMELKSQESTLEFENQLRNAHFITPIVMEQNLAQVANEKGHLTLKEGANISFACISDQSGSQFYPLFTDWAELYKWQKNPNQQTLIITLKDYLKMIEHVQGLVINPMTQSISIDKKTYNTLSIKLKLIKLKKILKLD